MVCMRLDLTVGMPKQDTVEELTHLLRVTTEVNRVGLGNYGYEHPDGLYEVLVIDTKG